VHSPVVCLAAKDRCVSATCLDPKGCVYETDEQCLADENEKKDYLITIGQPRLYKQSLMSQIFGAIGNFFKNLF
jgi:hypothetical protein